ncbi:helix-turn-helix domain-containing protein, partial [Vibrio sp. 10N.222.55.E8]
LWWWQNQQQDTLSQSLVNTESSEEQLLEKAIDPELTSVEVIEADQNTEAAPITENTTEDSSTLEPEKETTEIAPVATQSEPATTESVT